MSIAKVPLVTLVDLLSMFWIFACPEDRQCHRASLSLMLARLVTMTSKMIWSDMAIIHQRFEGLGILTL